MDTYTSNTKYLQDTVVPVVTKAKVTQIGDGNTNDTKITVTFSETVTVPEQDKVSTLTADGKTYDLNCEVATTGTDVVFTVKEGTNKVTTTAGILTGTVKAGTNAGTIVDSTGINTIDAATSIVVSQ